MRFTWWRLQLMCLSIYIQAWKFCGFILKSQLFSYSFEGGYEVGSLQLE